ncbi:hypothetical protein I7I51_01211 [Histoplasma capsulatum]|uniref:Uncharacterized protein n=1 Tax=Ajellomyces capsulatus TaxID=5037 RepID=A0A8A1MJ63_AJECA|nr:hypothetical protein I7I51_01211 [Histoplasma capsulatum]
MLHRFHASRPAQWNQQALLCMERVDMIFTYTWASGSLPQQSKTERFSQHLFLVHLTWPDVVETRNSSMSEPWELLLFLAHQNRSIGSTAILWDSTAKDLQFIRHYDKAQPDPMLATSYMDRIRAGWCDNCLSFPSLVYINHSHANRS